jgi:L-asparaginase
MHFSLLETGGTINGILGPDDVPPTESRVEAWLQLHSGDLDLQFNTVHICMKDSRAVTERDRMRLVREIRGQATDRILVPHGTYTMPDTGVYLRTHLEASALQKSIILTGSLIPLHEPGSDAAESLHFALSVLRDKPSGVWIAMQNRVWDPREVTKDEATGRYKPI